MEPQNHYPRSGGPQRSGEELHREDAGMYGSPSMSQASGNYYDGAQQLEPHDYDQQPEEELDDFSCTTTNVAGGRVCAASTPAGVVPVF